MKTGLRSRFSYAAKVSIGYALIAMLWIAASDYMVYLLFRNKTPEYIEYVHGYKGFTFVLVTATLLYFLLAHIRSSAIKSGGADPGFTRQALEESERKFRAVTEQSLTGIFIVTGERVAYANPRCAEITGYPEDKMIGMSVFNFIVESEHIEIAERMRRAYSGEEKIQRFDGHLKRRDGAVIDYGAHVAAIDYFGQPALLSNIQDITKFKQAQQREKAYVEQIEGAMRGSILAISKMVELRDLYTAGHEHRVGETAAAIGAELGLSDSKIRGLRVIGGLHDIGKISVPSEILTKPGRLSEAEYEIVKTHASNGHDILKSVEFPWPVMQVVLQHHERLDGSGYPNGLKGDQIVPLARIIAVADTVESMASHRPYRPALGINAALQEIEDYSGVRYDSDVAAACLRLFCIKNYRVE
ncbi:MAG TPA: HD domain-containing phosphohydrolase [Burkholderiales bacterium]|nr:HD domain-containing phosphohydrolase [Burkholderiales bacterium]